MVDLYTASAEATHLQLIKYIDSVTGKKETIRIYDELAPNWRKVGKILGFPEYTLLTVESPGSGKTPEQCITDIMGRWKDNAPNMVNKDRFPGNWRGVYNLLVDAEQGDLARRLDAAFKAQTSSLLGNFTGISPLLQQPVEFSLYSNAVESSLDSNAVESSLDSNAVESSLDSNAVESSLDSNSVEFSLDSNAVELSRWLKSKGLSEEECQIIRELRIGGRAFLSVTEDDLKEKLKISYGGILTLIALQKDVRGPADKPLQEYPEEPVAEEPNLSVSPGSTQTFIKKEHCGNLYEQLVPCATKWDVIARHLGFHEYEIDGIKSNLTYLAGAPDSYLGPMLSKWVQFSPPDSRGSKKRATLEALKSAVDSAGFAADAKELTL